MPKNRALPSIARETLPLNPRPKLWSAALLLGAALLPAGAGLLATSARAQEKAAADAATPEVVRLAILPMRVHSGESLSYLQAGLADMLTSRFEQSGLFEVVRVDDPDKATTRLADALEAARGLDAQFVLFGSFTRFGKGASLDMQCAATTEREEGNPDRQFFVQAGNIGDVIPDLEELVGRVARFAVSDFDGRGAVSSAPPGGGEADAGLAPTALDDLQIRVEALEEAIRRLDEALSADDFEQGDTGTGS